VDAPDSSSRGVLWLFSVACGADVELDTGDFDLVRGAGW
jgi:hypothetical protein